MSPKLATPAADIGRPGSARRSSLRLAPAQFISPDRGAADSRPPLALYRPQRNVKGLGAIVMLAGPAVGTYYDELAALGFHPRKHEGQWVFICPLSRWQTSDLLRAKTRLLLGRALNARVERLLELQAAVARLEGREAQARAFEAEAALRREKFNHQDTKAPSPEEQ